MRRIAQSLSRHLHSHTSGRTSLTPTLVRCPLFVSPPPTPIMSGLLAKAANSLTSATKDQNDPRYMYPSKFAAQEQPNVPGTEYNMDPLPDYGLDSYIGSNKLQGKVALITGGDSGIGRAVAWAYAKEGADVAITYVPMEQKDADEIVQQITTKTSQKCIAIAADFTKPADATMIVDETIKKFGKLDILVCNAAKQDKKVDDFTADDGFTYERVNSTFQVNIISMFMTCREALKIMKPGSSIITVASTNAYSPMDVVLDYSVTKGAIRTFTQGLSSAAIKKGVRVNCVAPGPIWTPIQPGSFPPMMVAQMGSSTPMERAGQPAELAGAFVYFASNRDSSYTNGMILGVTGGMLLA